MARDDDATPPARKVTPFAKRKAASIAREKENAVAVGAAPTAEAKAEATPPVVDRGESGVGSGVRAFSTGTVVPGALTKPDNPCTVTDDSEGRLGDKATYNGVTSAGNSGTGFPSPASVELNDTPGGSRARTANATPSRGRSSSRGRSRELQVWTEVKQGAASAVRALTPSRSRMRSKSRDRTSASGGGGGSTASTRVDDVDETRARMAMSERAHERDPKLVMVKIAAMYDAVVIKAVRSYGRPPPPPHHCPGPRTTKKST